MLQFELSNQNDNSESSKETCKTSSRVSYTPLEVTRGYTRNIVMNKCDISND